MNLNEAISIMHNRGYKIINEMAKAARNRILDRLTPKKKAIYILGRYYEKNGDDVGNTTLNQLKKYVNAKEPITGLSWDAFKEALNLDSALPPRRNNPHLKSTNIRRIVSDNAQLYQNILTTMERSKDDIDTNFVDSIYNYYKACKNGANPQDAYNEYNIGPAIEWLKQDETEAAERFGIHWPKIKKALRRYWDDSYEGSNDAAFDKFMEWYRAYKTLPTTPRLSDEVKKVLVKIAMDETSIDTYGPIIWQMRRTAEDWLGETLNSYINSHEMDDAPVYDEALQQEIENIINSMEHASNDEIARSSDNDDDPEIEMNSDNTITINRFVIPRNVISFMHDAATNPENVNTRNIGRTSKKQVIDCYKYCLNTLNKQAHIGLKGVYNPGIQEFYNVFKKVFKTGFTTEVMQQIFYKVALYLMARLENNINAYWRSVEDVNDVDDFNIDEALKILSSNGYNIIKG